MKRSGWIAAAVLAALVVVVVALFATDLKYVLVDLCNHAGGDLRSCYDVLAKPFEVS